MEEGQVIVIDTSVIIDHVHKKTTRVNSLLKKAAQGKIELAVSTITVFEYFSSYTFVRNNELEGAEMLFSKFTIVPVSKEVAQLAAQINRDHRLHGKVSTPDLLIGATALYLGAKILTRNKKDFARIPDLEFV